MRRLRMGTIGFAVALLLIAPRAASAGMGEVIDIIVGLTGPQMLGIPIGCDVNLRSRETACHISAWQVPAQAADVEERIWENRRVWLFVGGGAYVSTGRNSDMRDFRAFRVGMLALEPTVNYRTIHTNNGDFAVEHGAGASVLYLFGEGFESFVNSGIKIRPVALTWRNIGNSRFDFGVAYNVRIFPNAFTAQDFGAGPGTTTHTGREVAHGFTIIAGF